MRKRKDRVPCLTCGKDLSYVAGFRPLGKQLYTRKPSGGFQVVGRVCHECERNLLAQKVRR